jgi:hypothetical protein
MAEGSPNLSKLNLTKKIGPLPVWAWGLIAGSIIGLYLYSRNRGADSFAEEDEEIALEDASVEEGVGEGPGWTAFPPPTTPAPAPPDTFNNNRTWGVYAINLVVQQTSFSPAAVATAITKYLNSQPLNDLQYEIVSKAIELAGAAPKPLPLIRKPVKNPGGGGGNNPPGGPKPHPTPGDSRWYLIKSRKESLRGIARRFYRNPEDRWRDILNANRKGANRPGPTKGWMEGPQDIRPGRWLYIPGPTKDRPRPKK